MTREAKAVRPYITAGISVVLIAGALIASAPSASAGCQPWGLNEQLCDGPIQPDTTWQRCEVVHLAFGDETQSTCYTLGDNHWLPPFQPPGHIDP